MAHDPFEREADDFPSESEVRAEEGSPVEGDFAGSQFSLVSLMAAMLLFAAGIVLLQALGLFGVAIIVGIGMAASAEMLKARRPAGRYFFCNLLWGIVLPALCLLYDPGVLHNAGTSNFISGKTTAMTLLLAGEFSHIHRPWGFVVYFTAATQMIGFACWLVFRPYWAGRAFLLFFWSGFLSVGALVAAVVGAIIFPLTVVGLFFAGLGLPGFVPLLTAWTFGMQAWVAVQCTPWRSRLEEGFMPWTEDGFLDWRGCLALLAGAAAALLPAVIAMLI